MNGMKMVGAFITVLALMLGITWIAQGNEFFLYKVFAPKYENARRQVFEQSKAYNQGMVQELQNMQFEYVKASDSQKDALASIILHRSADFNFDDKRVPADLKTFVEGLRRERTTNPSSSDINKEVK